MESKTVANQDISSKI